MFEKYQNPEIQKEILQKGFCVYEYLDMGELFGAIAYEYMKVYTQTHKILGGLLIAFFVIIYGVAKSDGPLKLLVFLFLGISAIVVLYMFLYIAIQGIVITKLFVQYRYVIYTKDLLVLNTTLYKANTKIPIIHTLEEVFHEPLGQESSLQGAVRKQSRVFHAQLLSPFDGDPGSWIFAVPLYILSWCLYIVCYGILMLLFGIYALLLRIFLLFHFNVGQRIKTLFFQIETGLQNIAHSKNALQKSTQDFLSGKNINISHTVDTHLPHIYSQMIHITRRKNLLYHHLQSTSFHDSFDFDLLHSYMKHEFNTPLNDILQILSTMHERIVGQMQEIQNAGNHQPDAILTAHLQVQTTRLKHQNNLILSHIAQLKQSLL